MSNTHSQKLRPLPEDDGQLMLIPDQLCCVQMFAALRRIGSRLRDPGP